MSKRNLEIGDLVTVLHQDWQGDVGIVTHPITQDHPGHVLIHQDGSVFGVSVSLEDVTLADESSEGFAQLAYTLVKLGSHVIEARLI